MISIKTLVFNPFAENTYIIYDETGECAIIDPGCSGADEENTLVDELKKDGLTPVLLLNTHCHIDHVLGNKFIKEKFNLELQIPLKDEATYNAVPTYAGVYGFPNYEHVEADHFLEDGDTIEFGHSRLDVVFVPGHTEGHLAFISEPDNICIAGDVLFDGSIGRTDLPGGDYNTLISSIHNRLFKYPDEMVVYSGHGETTTIGKEKKSNPFCAVK